MKYFLLAIFLVSALFSVKAQAFPPALTQKFNITRKLTDEYFVFEKNGKSGVVNKSGAIILSAAYPGIYNTMYDLFVVRNDVAQGVVKAKDITVLPLAFEEIDILSPQRIHVRKNGISFIVSPSNQFLADTTEGPTTLFQMDGNMLTSPGILAEVELAAFKANNFLKMDGAVFMIKGKDTTRTAYQDIQPLANNGSRIKFKQNERWGIIDNDGRELVPAMYDDIEQDDHTGLTKVSREKKQSLLDRELKPLPAGPFDRIGYFTSSDIAVMSNDSKEGLINSSGTILLYPVKGTIREYGNQFFEIRYDTVEKTDIVDRNMKSILPAGTFMKGYVGNIILVITADKKMGVVHAAGYTLLQPVYDEVFFGNTDGEDIRFFQVRKDTKWGILDLAGKQLIPYLYDKINLFSDGYAPAILNGKGGVITEKNKVVVPFIYDETGYEYNKLDLLSVKKDGHSGFVNKTGAVIFPVIYESLNDDFDGGLCLARKDGKWGYLDQNGKTVIPFEYDEASPFYSGKTKVKKANTWYEIDKTGKILSQSPDKN